MLPNQPPESTGFADDSASSDRMASVAFETEIALVAVDRVPDPDQIRAFWKANESKVLDAMAPSDRLWIGTTRAVTPDEPRSPGRAGHVFDLLFLAGTTPEYTAPRITEQLIADVVTAFLAPDDSDLPSASPDQLQSYLSANLGRYLVIEG